MDSQWNGLELFLLPLTLLAVALAGRLLAAVRGVNACCASLFGTAVFPRIRLVGSAAAGCASPLLGAARLLALRLRSRCAPLLDDAADSILAAGCAPPLPRCFVMAEAGRLRWRKSCLELAEVILNK